MDTETIIACIILASVVLGSIIAGILYSYVKWLDRVDD